MELNPIVESREREMEAQEHDNLAQKQRSEPIKESMEILQKGIVDS